MVGLLWILHAAVPSSGSEGFDPKTGKFDYSVLKPVLETVMGIKEDGSFYPGAEGLDNDPARARFAEGNIGMKFAWSWDVGVFNDQFAAKCDWGVAPIPVEDKNICICNLCSLDGHLILMLILLNQKVQIN